MDILPAPRGPLRAELLNVWIDQGKSYIESLPSPHTPAYIYGYGVYGRDLLHRLRQSGARVEGFIDRNKAGENAVETNTAILHPEDIGRLPIIIQSINNPIFNVGEVNQSLLGKCEHLLNPLQALWWGGAELLWSAQPSHYLPHLDAIVACADRMQTDSKEVYAGIWHDRLTGSFSTMNRAAGNPYFPLDVPGIPRQMVLIDCGAYDGDVARDAIRTGHELKGLVAFEPDPANFARLLHWIDTSRHQLGATIALPAAVGEFNSILCFESGLSTSSHLSEQGAARVPCVRLDDVLVHHPADYIKLDVEGAEGAALRGAARTICTQRPALAVSIYHRPNDLFELPALIDSICGGYEFRLRLHALAGIDMVLYATRPSE